MGHNIDEVAKKAAAIAGLFVACLEGSSLLSEFFSLPGVSKVIVLDNEKFAKPVAEDITKALLPLTKDSSYTHILTPSSNTGSLTLRLQCCLFIFRCTRQEFSTSSCRPVRCLAFVRCFCCYR
jgi:electron transfer flavoprotein alpha subunit